jgi:UDPglucose 6-dehydrogenase
MNIGVVGFGIVGKAVAEGFRQHGHIIYVNDLPENIVLTPITSANKNDAYYLKNMLALKCDLIFICVPTPCKKTGEIDLTHIYEVAYEFNLIAQENHVPPLIIKSTVTPKTTQSLNEQYPKLQFSFNPEFLTAKNSLQDFLNPDRTVFGVLNQHEDTLRLLMEAYKDFPGEKMVTSPTQAELIKYLSNIYLVCKVAFGLEAKRICDAVSGNGALTVMVGVGLDKRIDASHLNPNKGKIPVDSPCLPKDFRAFLKFLEKNKVKSSLLEEIWSIGVEKECQS